MHRGALFTANLSSGMAAAALGAPYVPFAPAATVPVFAVVSGLMALVGWRGSRPAAGILGVTLWSMVWIVAEVKVDLDALFEEPRRALPLGGFRVVMALLIGGAGVMALAGWRERPGNKAALPRVVVTCTAARCARLTCCCRSRQW